MSGHNWWKGNWWAGAPAALPSGSPALDDQILSLVKPALETITVVNGYHQTVATVYQQPTVTPMDVAASACPVLFIRRVTKRIKAHLRRAEEFVLVVRIIALVDKSGADPDLALANLLIDVKKVIYANRFWHNGIQNLACRTYFVEDDIHETECPELTLSGACLFEILARADRNDLSQVREV
jgi:hypothetical protein